MARGGTTKELVVELIGCAMWYHMWAKDDLGDDIVILCTDAEKPGRDDHARVYYIKENTDLTVRVEEVLLVPRTADETTLYAFKQVEPYVQDSEGYLYFNHRLLAGQPTNTKRYKLARRGKQMLYTFVNPVFIH